MRMWKTWSHTFSVFIQVPVEQSFSRSSISARVSSQMPSNALTSASQRKSTSQQLSLSPTMCDRSVDSRYRERCAIPAQSDIWTFPRTRPGISRQSLSLLALVVRRTSTLRAMASGGESATIARRHGPSVPFFGVETPARTARLRFRCPPTHRDFRTEVPESRGLHPFAPVLHVGSSLSARLDIKLVQS